MHVMHFPLEPKTKPNKSKWKEGDLKWALLRVEDADQW